MRATFQFQYNVFSSLIPLRRAPRAKVWVLPAALLVFLANSGGASKAAVMPYGTPGSLASAREGWVDVLQSMLGYWRRYLECTGPGPQEPVAAVIGFNECWASNGLPNNLTDSDRKFMLSEAAALEHHILADPGHLPPDLKQTTLTTIQSIRGALAEPNPVPATGSALPDPSL